MNLTSTSLRVLRLQTASEVSSRRWWLDRKPLQGLAGGGADDHWRSGWRLPMAILNFDLLNTVERRPSQTVIYSNRLLHFCSLDGSILCAIALHRLLILCAYPLIALCFIASIPASSSSSHQPHVRKSKQFGLYAWEHKIT